MSHRNPISFGCVVRRVAGWVLLFWSGFLGFSIYEDMRPLPRSVADVLARRPASRVRVRLEGMQADRSQPTLLLRDPVWWPLQTAFVPVVPIDANRDPRGVPCVLLKLTNVVNEFHAQCWLKGGRIAGTVTGTLADFRRVEQAAAATIDPQSPVIRVVPPLSWRLTKLAALLIAGAILWATPRRQQLRLPKRPPPFVAQRTGAAHPSHAPRRRPGQLSLQAFIQQQRAELDDAPSDTTLPERTSPSVAPVPPGTPSDYSMPKSRMVVSR